MSTESDFDPRRNGDLVRLRKHVAGMIKDLVAARAKDDPVWCVNENIDQIWFFSTRRPVDQSVIYLLREAERRFRQFHDEYCSPLFSTPCEPEPFGSTIEIVEQLRDLLSQFTDPADLSFAAEQLRQNERVNWRQVADWSRLAELRNTIDSLPDCAGQSRPAVGDYGLRVDGSGVCYDGRPLDCPPQPRNLLYHLLQQREHRCHIDDLAEAVWNDPAKRIRRTDRDSVKKRTRAWLREHGIPFTVTQRGNEFLLVAARLENAEED